MRADEGQARQWLEAGEYARALSAAEALLAETPGNRELLYALAVSQRHLQRVPAALETLARLEALHPNFARLFQERGRCFIALRSAGRAITAFERAVQLSPALPASWQALLRLYRMSGREPQAANAAAQFAKLARLPRDIVTATAMFADGDLPQAERLLRQYLLAHGDHIEAMRLLAKIGLELEVLEDAELLLEQVLRLAPDYHAARHDYVVVLLKRHKHLRAREQLQQLLEREPTNRLYRTTQAAVSMGYGQHQQALEQYRALLTESPSDAELHLSVAHALKTLGRAADAIGSYRAAAAARRGCGEAYWGLANLKTYRFQDDELACMRTEEAAAGTAAADRYHLSFALGKALEDRGAYRESFECYARGNALKHGERPYRPELIEATARLQRALCTAEFLHARQGFGCSSAAPIFIVGLPRSGSTLLEQILASHSQVEATTELADIPRLVQTLHGRSRDETEPGYPGALSRLSAGDCARLGEQYLADTRIYRARGRPFFIDKNPNNFRHLGLIQLLFPQARIIDARRGAMACCFGNFKQLFAVGQRFSYRLEHLARYYRCYIELMQHWDTVLPGRILRVQHEQVVEDLPGSVRRMLEFCGLAFEPGCLEFFRTERGIETASSEQVRQPIYRHGLHQWRHYAPWLEPLRSALGSLAEE